MTCMYIISMQATLTVSYAGCVQAKRYYWNASKIR